MEIECSNTQIFTDTLSDLEKLKPQLFTWECGQETRLSLLELERDIFFKPKFRV